MRALYRHSSPAPQENRAASKWRRQWPLVRTTAEAPIRAISIQILLPGPLSGPHSELALRAVEARQRGPTAHCDSTFLWPCIWDFTELTKPPNAAAARALQHRPHSLFTSTSHPLPGPWDARCLVPNRGIRTNLMCWPAAVSSAPSSQTE